mmetsp:Transcript_6823/g.12149  ORF Transcript_6823/g.12149 Transcript_6823/m.12149 type:complete len:367 (-) Transcript_6823:573-1673(-)
MMMPFSQHFFTAKSGCHQSPIIFLMASISIPGMPGRPPPPPKSGIPGIPGMPPPCIIFIAFCMPSTPPICFSNAGSMFRWSCANFLGSFIIWAIWRCWAAEAPPPPPGPPPSAPMRPALPNWPTMPSKDRWQASSARTSVGWVPDPRAMRSIRLSHSSTTPSNSLSVMLSIMYMNRLNRLPVSWSLPACAIHCGMPGIMPSTLCMGPSFIMFWNCSYKSLRVNLPLARFSSISCLRSPETPSCSCASRPPRSPNPSSFETNPRASNGSRSSKCSPSPRKMMGLLVAATALRAPPPLAWPSSFVITHAPTSTAALNPSACSWMAWPWVASITKTTLSGSTTAWISCISSKSASSCRCRPEVSTMISS